MTRVIVAVIMGGLFAALSISRFGEQKGKGPRYLPYLFSGILPAYVTTILVSPLVLKMFGGWTGWDEINWDAIAWIWVIFLHISLYFILLSLALPLLRRYLWAGTCAMLWIIPNFLYLTYSINQSAMPRWIIPIPRGWIEVLILVWLAGMLAVLGWKIFSHLRFRRWLLRGAVEVSDPQVLAVWQAEVERAQVKNPRFRLVTSPQATTPMTIGLFSKGVRVVLPQRSYTPEELKLMFRHELVHIGREDTWNKFFLVFCSAMCWFNPFMWLAMRRSSEDLELSCDETVLIGLDEGERRQYADLILRTAGDSRGFTTCLSASASALRYRLKSIVNPGRKFSGALLVGLTFVVLFLTCGQVGLAYGAGTGESAIYFGNIQDVSLRQIRRETGNTSHEVLECRDEEGLRNYLASLDLFQMGEIDNYDGEGERLILLYDAPKGTLSVILWDNYIKVVPLWEGTLSAYYYYVSGGLDWDVLKQHTEIYSLPEYEPPDTLSQHAGFPDSAVLPPIQ